MITYVSAVFSHRGKHTFYADPLPFYHTVFDNKFGIAGVTAHNNGLIRNSSDIDRSFAVRTAFPAAVDGSFQKI